MKKQNRKLYNLQNVLRDAAEEEFPQAAMAISTNDQHAGAFFVSGLPRRIQEFCYAVNRMTRLHWVLKTVAQMLHGYRAENISYNTITKIPGPQPSHSSNGRRQKWG